MAEDKQIEARFMATDKPTQLFRVVYLPKEGTHQVEVQAVSDGDPGVVGLILADTLRTFAGLFEELGVCSRLQAEQRILETFTAEIEHPTSGIKEFAREIPN